MAKKMQNLTGLIAGAFKVIEPTEKRDIGRRVIWKLECVCGKYEYLVRPDIEKYAGYGACPGHPLKAQPSKMRTGFTLHPDLKGTIEQAEAARDWELMRNRELPEEVRLSEPSVPDQQDAPETSEVLTDKDISLKPSAVLQKRLGLSGYTTSSVALTSKMDLLGCKAEKVVFAKQIGGTDLVLLHVQLIDAKGKRSIVSSKKKVPESEWSTLTTQLEEMKIYFREKEMKRKAA